MESLEVIGSFWLPNNPSAKVAGILKFEQPDWPRLELIGAFESTFSNPEKSHEIILGLSRDGKFITLTNCQETSRTFASVGMETTTYTGLFVFVGRHFDRIAEINFSKAWLDFTYLFEWIGGSAVEQDFEQLPNRKI